MRLSEDSLPQRCDGFERLHCLAEIVERGTFVEEDKRHKASCVRASWALIDPTGEARATAPGRWGP